MFVSGGGGDTFPALTIDLGRSTAVNGVQIWNAETGAQKARLRDFQARTGPNPRRRHTAIGLHADTTAQSIEHQGLLGFGHTDFPRRPSVLDG
jgi:hypothetical protein